MDGVFNPAVVLLNMRVYANAQFGWYSPGWRRGLMPERLKVNRLLISMRPMFPVCLFRWADEEV